MPMIKIPSMQWITINHILFDMAHGHMELAAGVLLVSSASEARSHPYPEWSTYSC